jgi:hypothetical protein
MDPHAKRAVIRHIVSSGLLHLSLSRLNHRLPRAQTHPEVMQGTAAFHHEIGDAVLPQPDPVFHNAAALDAAVDMLDPQPARVESLVGALLLHGQLLAPGVPDSTGFSGKILTY